MFEKFEPLPAEAIELPIEIYLVRRDEWPPQWYVGEQRIVCHTADTFIHISQTAVGDNQTLMQYQGKWLMISNDNIARFIEDISKGRLQLP